MPQELKTDRELLTAASIEVQKLAQAISEIATEMGQMQSDRGVSSGLRIMREMLNHLYSILDEADTDASELGIESVFDQLRRKTD